ncbi:hypothetical protein HK100_008122 [Physocladia obscura]|uniref:Uncharacterized protein n=1 Tax=Physocladia obscura TaxID=109957 RepID=A0AAD5T4C1_9FUNG|nr:hypothetical protein HK100_008122 [Physocladia obscura]
MKKTVYTLEMDVRLLRAIEAIGPHVVASRRESGARWERVAAALAGTVISALQTVTVPSAMARGGAADTNACVSSPPASDRDNAHTNVSDGDDDGDDGDDGDNDEEPVNADGGGVCFDFSDITSINTNNRFDGTNSSATNPSNGANKLSASTTAHSVRTRLRNLASRWLYCATHGLPFSMPKQAQTADSSISVSSLVQERDHMLAAIVKEIEQASDSKKAVAEEAILSASLPLAAQVAAAKSAKIEATLQENSASSQLNSRTRYTVAQRLEAVARAKDIGVNKAAKEFGINKSLISRWIKSAESWDASEMGATTLSATGINNILLSSPLPSIGTSPICSENVGGTALSLLKKRVAKKPSLSTATSHDDDNNHNHDDHKLQFISGLEFDLFDNTTPENSFLIGNNLDIYSSENSRKRMFGQKNTQPVNKRSRSKDVEQTMTLFPVESMPTTIITPPITSTVTTSKIIHIETSNICVTDELILQNNTTVCDHCNLKNDGTNSSYYSGYTDEKRCDCVINDIVYTNTDSNTVVDWSAVVSAGALAVVAAAGVAAISMNGDISISGGGESAVDCSSGSSCATLSQRSGSCSGRSSQENSPMVSMNNVMVSGRGSDVFDKNTSAVMHGSPLEYQLQIKSAVAAENLHLLTYEANSNLASGVCAISTNSIIGRQLDGNVDEEEAHLFDDVILEPEDEGQEAEKKTAANNSCNVGSTDSVGGSGGNDQSLQSLSQELDRNVCESIMFPMLSLSDMDGNPIWPSMQGTIDDVVSGNYGVGDEASFFQLLE